MWCLLDKFTRIANQHDMRFECLLNIQKAGLFFSPSANGRSLTTMTPYESNHKPLADCFTTKLRARPPWLCNSNQDKVSFWWKLTRQFAEVCRLATEAVFVWCDHTLDNIHFSPSSTIPSCASEAFFLRAPCNLSGWTKSSVSKSAARWRWMKLPNYLKKLQSPSVKSPISMSLAANVEEFPSAPPDTTN